MPIHIRYQRGHYRRLRAPQKIKANLGGRVQHHPRRRRQMTTSRIRIGVVCERIWTTERLAQSASAKRLRIAGDFTVKYSIGTLTLMSRKAIQHRAGIQKCRVHLIRALIRLLLARSRVTPPSLRRIRATIGVRSDRRARPAIVRSYSS